MTPKTRKRRAAKKNITEMPMIRIDISDTAKVSKLGLNFIRLGVAMTNENTELAHVCDLAYECGFCITFHFGNPENS